MIEIYKLEDKQKEHLRCLYCGNKKADFMLFFKSKLSADAFISSSVCKNCLSELKEEFNQGFNYLSNLSDLDINIVSSGLPLYFPPIKEL